MANTTRCDSCKTIFDGTNRDELYIYKCGFWTFYMDSEWNRIDLCPKCFKGLKKIGESK